MTDVRVQIDEAAISELFTDPAGPVAQYVYELTDEIRTVAKAIAPVSSRGSQWSSPGMFKAKIRATHGHDSAGVVQGKVSAPNYPGAFLFNNSGRTQNANQYGHYGYRSADRNTLFQAMTTVFETTVL